ncbi:hypothetical protein BH18ACT13_BH18ACT13_18010 [soil metagenome]
MAEERFVPPEEEEGVWCVTEGELSRQAQSATYRADGIENLTYNNSYSLGIERVWFDRRIVYACESGEIELQFDEQRVAVGNKVRRSTRSSTRSTSTSTGSSRAAGSRSASRVSTTSTTRCQAWITTRRSGSSTT